MEIQVIACLPDQGRRANFSAADLYRISRLARRFSDFESGDQRELSSFFELQSGRSAGSRLNKLPRRSARSVRSKRFPCNLSSLQAPAAVEFGPALLEPPHRKRKELVSRYVATVPFDRFMNSNRRRFGMRISSSPHRAMPQIQSALPESARDRGVAHRVRYLTLNCQSGHPSLHYNVF